MTLVDCPAEAYHVITNFSAFVGNFVVPFVDLLLRPELSERFPHMGVWRLHIAGHGERAYASHGYRFTGSCNDTCLPIPFVALSNRSLEITQR